MLALSRPKLWIYGLLALIVAGGAASLWVARVQVKQANQSIQKTTAASQSEIIGENVTFTITEADRKKWDLLVQRARYFKDRSGAKLQGVSGTFYDAQGKPVARFQSPAGETLNAGKRVRLTGGVQVKSIDQADNTLISDTLTWPASDGAVEAQGRVRVTMAGGTTSTAQRCHFSLDFSRMTLQGDVRSAVEI
ncbi:MAG: LPS export ABC transporter periplasmic protein LptC [Vampirovibrionales bacterium]|nr:LPS export ABC transporter periplasmic protein LptC [Vampirovibrionales bacterium]